MVLLNEISPVAHERDPLLTWVTLAAPPLPKLCYIYPLVLKEKKWKISHSELWTYGIAEGIP